MPARLRNHCSEYESEFNPAGIAPRSLRAISIFLGLLLCAAAIARALDCGQATVERIRKRFVMEGFEAALGRKHRTNYEYKLDGKDEAHLIALACGKPPKGYNRWTLRLLADKMVELEYVDSLSYQTVRRTLKKTNLSLG